MEINNKIIQRKLRKLEALEKGGVASWDRYNESLKEHFKECEKEDFVEEIVQEILTIVCVECDIVEPAGSGAGYGIRNREPVEQYIKDLLDTGRIKLQEDNTLEGNTQEDNTQEDNTQEDNTQEDNSLLGSDFGMCLAYMWNLSQQGEYETPDDIAKAQNSEDFWDTKCKI